MTVSVRQVSSFVVEGGTLEANWDVGDLFPAVTNPGSTLVLALLLGQTFAAISSITDADNNGWQQVPGAFKSGITGSASLWYSPGIRASSRLHPTIHYSATGSSLRVIAIELWSDSGAVQLLPASGTFGSASSGTSLAIAGVAASLAGDLPLTALTNVSATSAIGLTGATWSVDASVASFGVGHSAEVSTRTAGATWTWTSSSANAGVLAVFTDRFSEPPRRPVRPPGRRSPAAWAQPIRTDGVDTTTTTPISDSDSFAWTDEDLSISLANSEVFAWTENQTIAATLSSSESVAWTEGTPVIRVSDSDSFAWTESQAVSVSRSDSETFAWTDANPTIKVNDSDSATWSEGTPTVRVSDSDSFAWSEGTATIRVTDSELATWSEGTPSIRVSDTDTAAWAESQSSSSTLSSSESATWTENQTVNLRDSDSAVWAEGTPQIRTSDTEAAAWADGNPSIRTSDTESAAWSDANPTIRVANSDSVAFSDAGESTRLTDFDSALWTEGQAVNIQTDLYMDWRIPRPPGRRSPAAWPMPIQRAEATSAVNPFPTDSETFFWSETQSLAATLSDADSATWSEGTPTIRLSDSDSLSWSEGTASIRISDSDATAWSEGVPTVRIAGNESIAWSESNQISARPIDSDSILWGDAQSLRALFTSSETWQYADDQSVATADPRVRGTFIRPDGSPISGVAIIKIAQEQPGIGVVIIGRFQVAFSGILDVPLPATRLGNHYEVAIYPEGQAPIRFDVPVTDVVLL